MNTLYIDTHSENLEMIFFRDGILLEKKEIVSFKNHSSIAMPLFCSLLDSVHLNIHDIDEIIVINGPGSFTGIRIGVTIAKTLAYTLNIPIKVMSSLLIKAITYKEKGHHWFVEPEKNGYFIGEFNELNELLKDYFYVKKSDYEIFLQKQDVVLVDKLDYEEIYNYSTTLNAVIPHMVNPLYVKIIEVQT